jgi:pyridoxine 4-dehydrogenase
MASAKKSGIFKIGGDLPVHRLGFGAMRITGSGIWGEPADRPEALRVLKRLPQLDVDFIDTANSYGPEVSEKLIHEALAPYNGLVVATKAGLTRSGPNRWTPKGKQDYLISEAHASRKRLGVEIIDLWQLHRIDSAVPRDEQFSAASRFFKVATVQNKYNLTDRASEDVLDYCEKNGIGFIPWFPLASGELSKPGGLLDRVAHAHKASVGQIALAWLLKRSPVMLPIPGTSKVSHLEENVAAAEIELSDAEFTELDKAGRG